MTDPTIVQGIVAAFLAVLAQKVLAPKVSPMVGDRLAALLALVVGAALVANTILERWLVKGAAALSRLAGQAAASVDPRLGQGVATVIVGCLVTVLFVLWVVAFIPGTRLAKKVTSGGGGKKSGGVPGEGGGKKSSSSSGNRIDPRLIWGGGLLLPVLVVLVPGAGILHTVSAWTVHTGIHAGTWLVSWA